MVDTALVPEWSPEIEVGEELARRLVGEQFPELPATAFELLGEGWDNTAWLVDGEWVFRFPRRKIALPGVERELALLPELAPQLPRPVPRPELVGRPGAAFPWPFFGARLVEGVELLEADVVDRAALARDLGEFLRALHDAEVAYELPYDPISRADMSFRVPRARQRLEEIGVEVPGAEELFEAALALPPPELGAVVHGDLHLRHALVAGGRLSGVIDWGDACRSDPAVDLVLVWAALPPAARPAFFAAYGDLDGPAEIRSKVLSLFLCAALAEHARAIGNERGEREALAGIERTLEA
jgi:aminoglycoside phosphotransferase (APT) family kinase protein